MDRKFCACPHLSVLVSALKQELEIAMHWVIGVIKLAVGIVVLALLGLGAMRFVDGPMGMLSGGAFSSGELQASARDFSMLEGRDTIEFQTMDPATSRTIWLVVFETRLFLVSGYMNSSFGKLWKQWPSYLERDDSILIRADGRIYPQRLERLLDAPEIPAVMGRFAEKYNLGSVDTPPEAVRAMIKKGDAWLFEVLPVVSS